jgi:hypothetical protein
MKQWRACGLPRSPPRPPPGRIGRDMTRTQPSRQGTFHVCKMSRRGCLDLIQPFKSARLVSRRRKALLLAIPIRARSRRRAGRGPGGRSPVLDQVVILPPPGSERPASRTTDGGVQRMPRASVGWSCCSFSQLRIPTELSLKRESRRAPTPRVSAYHHIKFNPDPIGDYARTPRSTGGSLAHSLPSSVLDA